MNWLNHYWKWIALGLGLILLSIALSFLPVAQWVKAFADWIRHLGLAGAFIFIGVYALGAVLFLPGAIFTIAAGLVYGIAGGTAVALAGATLGAGLAFLVARYLVRGRIEEFAQKNRRFGAIDNAIGEEGWKIVGLLRLSPLIPFNVSNYFYGLTSIGFWPYLIASGCGHVAGHTALRVSWRDRPGRVGGWKKRIQPAPVDLSWHRASRHHRCDRVR